MNSLTSFLDQFLRGVTMKKLAVKDAEACMICLTCERACAQAFYKTENPIEQDLSCIHIGQKNGKPKITVCVQCGKCAKSCPEGAIKANPAGVFMVNKKLCKNCGKCIQECPFKVIVQSKNATAISKCIACGICAKVCPQGILYIKSDEAA
jgi:Fe-S-cluster-containing hydrogenase component 2